SLSCCGRKQAVVAAIGAVEMKRCGPRPVRQGPVVDGDVAEPVDRDVGPELLAVGGVGLEAVDMAAPAHALRRKGGDPADIGADVDEINRTAKQLQDNGG